ncbi:E3 ubiquitin-protein ligase TRIM33-like [Contarinia nasturtii]|uniref:E3 ubiquitin-protein ligase TRIM33-like n=1 Tax=Contarinia nasturtii TaxID=265458 RepID=UPI0012D43873|nr:E3 ubiquitin-protein ligase TRIM33-like [Contarinia nasturtii]XP_031634167.1 E3 ubiquitin-protein ligase TRIM33-like [Contarinia nasturtii]
MDQFLIELSEAKETQASSDVDAKTIKCTNCTDDAPATSSCVECAEYICESCVQAHQRLKFTRNHTINTKEEALIDDKTTTNDEKMLMCHVHPQEKLSLFCETCDISTCRDCQLVDHRYHKYKDANETRATLKLLLNELTYKRDLLNSEIKAIDEREKLIADGKEKLVTKITNMVVRITNTVYMRGKQLEMRLSEVCDGESLDQCNDRSC